MQIKVTSIAVDDQDKALAFYTDKLGFIKKTEIPVGKYKWLTVVSPEDPDGVELSLEPNAFEPAQIFYKSLYDAGIPATMFNVDDINSEYLRLKELGVEFSVEPTKSENVTYAVLDDTCGNRIQIVQM